MKFYCKRVGHALHPASDIDLEFLEKIPANADVHVSVVRQRNTKFHRMVFAAINIVFQNQEYFQDVEEFRKAMIIESGYYVRLGGNSVMAKSLSFSSMDETEFQEFWSALLETFYRLFGIENIEEQLIELGI